MNGIILIDKPKDYTSRDIVNIVGKCLQTKKVGHTGTLDPLATGILVIAVNKGLKIIDLLVSDNKEYIVDVKMGLATDTLDITGQIIHQNDSFDIDEVKLKKVLASFLGDYEQEVPKYSAVRVNGKRLYEYARNKEIVTLPKRIVNIYQIELLDFHNDTFKFKVLVSKGTYIRSLVRDIGQRLNVNCTMSELRRTKQGFFNIEDCCTLKDIELNKFDLIPLKDALINYKCVVVDRELEKKIMNGAILDNIYDEDIIVFLNKNETVIAIYTKYSKDVTKIKPKHVIDS